VFEIGLRLTPDEWRIWLHRGRRPATASGNGDYLRDLLLLACSEDRHDQPGLPIHCESGVQPEAWAG